MISSLKLTASLHLKMDGWNTRTFPFGAFRPIFRCYVCQFQGGYLFSTIRNNELFPRGHEKSLFGESIQELEVDQGNSKKKCKYPTKWAPISYRYG